MGLKRNSNGHPIGFQGIARDITERKLAENTIIRERDYFSKVLYWVDSLVVVIDIEGHLVSFNRASEQLSGYRFEELQGRPFWETLLAPDEKESVKTAINDVLRKELPKNFLNHWVTKTGEKRLIQWNNSILKKEDGYIEYILCTGLDITERKVLENQLRQAHKMESMGTLAGGIAHEFNNILGIIIGNAELALDDVPEWNPAKDCLEEIRVASLRAKDVVRKIMSFSRKTPIQRKPVQISTIVKESLKLIRATVPTSIEIQEKTLCESEMILANPTEINQILLNLCNNSVHAMRDNSRIFWYGLR